MTEIYEGDKRGFCVAREELADADIGSDWADVVFTAASDLPDGRMLEGGVIWEIDGDYVSLDAAGEAATEDAMYRVRVRNAGGSWRTLGTEATVTASEAVGEVYSGNVRAHQLKFQVKYATSDGGTGAIGVCFK